jgi:hypothetical protein
MNLPKTFNVSTDTGEHTFIAFSTFDKIGVAIYRIKNEKEFGRLFYALSPVKLAIFAHNGNKLWSDVVDYAIQQFKQSSWVKELVENTDEKRTFEDILDIL